MMNLQETGIEKFIAPLIVIGILLFGLLKGFFTCRGWYREVKEARQRKQKEAVEHVTDAAQKLVIGEREIADQLKRLDAAQDEENRILALQLERAKVTMQGQQITIDRQVKALIDCWQGHPTSRNHVDVLIELEAARQRQDQLEAKIQSKDNST
jgi:hypothetical protein